MQAQDRNMASSFSSRSSHEDTGVFELVSVLCNKTASKYCLQSGVSQTRLVSKMRSLAYEVILKRSSNEIPETKQEPIAGLLSHYFTSLSNTQNVAEYKRSIELKKVISTLRQTDFGEHKDLVHNVLRLLSGLSNTVKEDLSNEMYQRPFTCGLLEQMLPKLPREQFGSPQPYSYYPSHVFQLPYSLKRQVVLENTRSYVYSEYTVESFDSRSLLPCKVKSANTAEVKTFASPMSLPSMSSSYVTAYSGNACLDLPRITAPRDLLIPSTERPKNLKVSLADTRTDVNEVFKADFRVSEPMPDIWEIASQVDKDIPDDIWQIVSKMPPIEERQLIASSSREVMLWRQTYGGMTSELNVISEKQFIRHVMYLLIGIETNSFPFNQKQSYFYMKENLILEGISKEHIKGYVADLLLVGTYYKRLYNFAFNQTLEDHFHGKGLVYEASREVIRRYLLDFRLKATEIYEECCKQGAESINCMPTLLQILFHMEPLKYEIETIASIYKMIDIDDKSCIPNGAELMSYLFNEISLVTHKITACTMFNALFSVCAVYFKFIERFIFEGELDDRYNEFFIRKDSQYVNCRSKKYWDKGFHITQSVAVPDFLRNLAKCVLLCGKSLRLLKLCNPSDPLVVLISSDHPSVKCCSSFEELERQQQVLDVYRTRCLFVSGEPVTFEQIVLKREAERKAFTEMASIKQHETLEKIVAERKRLAQLIIAEKQHSLRVLEAAMAEAKAAKNKNKQRERLKTEMERAAEKSCEEVDSKLRHDEREKIMEYYSKLNMEVEKSKIHMEWKIKRLQLDQSRMQLLSTEERNLKREKLEMQHQRHEEVMAMSIRSDCDVDVNGSEDQNIECLIEIKQPESLTSSSSELYQNKAQSHTSGDIISAICNVAKSFFGGSKSEDNKNCDNKKELDAQGNIVTTDSEEVNSNEGVVSKTSSDVIGGHLDNKTDNIEYLKTKQEALVNRKKVMAHEFGQIDPNKNLPLINLQSYDDENNIEDSTTAFAEAKRNKLKVLGAEYNIVKAETTQSTREPITDAQKEALINKQKVLGVEYNIPPEVKVSNDPANIAQEEAITNKQKVMGVEYNLPLDVAARKEPANFAQEQALVNRIKVLGSDYDLGPYESSEVVRREPANVAQEEAVRNRMKILGSDYDLGPYDSSESVRREPANAAQEEAVRNRTKVLGSDYDLGPYDSSEFVRREPANAAQEEAVRNRTKVLGSDYDLGPYDSSEFVRREPANAAQEEAVRNRTKVLGSDYDLGPYDSSEFVRREPANAAQEEAVRNRMKVLGSDYDLGPYDSSEFVRREPANAAQEEAVRNRTKVLGSDYDLGPYDSSELVRREPANAAQEEAVRNRTKVLGSDYDLGPYDSSELVRREPANAAQEEAVRNRTKVLGSDYDLGPYDHSEVLKREPANYAQTQALINRNKVLGSDYDKGPFKPENRREPATFAQEQAVINRKRVQGSDYDGRPADMSSRHGNARRSGLTLNLQPYSEPCIGSLGGVTPNTGAVTPAEFFPRLDLETPTTADVPPMTGDILSPRSDAGKDIESTKTKNDKEYLTSEGFNFSIIVDEDPEATPNLQAGDSVDNSLSKRNYPMKKLSAFDIIDGSYTLEDFDPFGMKQFKKYTKDHFNSKMDLDMSFSCYTHPGAIMEKVQKKPYKNIFLSHLGSKDDEQSKITNDNIATLTACLQRSVMLPLTYQLEVVNNSILTYFLVNLDMYEHLRSLKDYFFLMDGEFSRSICHNLFTKLVKTLNPQELLNFSTLHNILDKALGSSISHVHKFSENLSFTMTEPPLSFQHSSPDVLLCLSLTYQVNWPLNIILSQEALLRYAKVFQFLIKMRRISWVLGEDFECLKLSAKLSRNDSRKLLRSPQYISVQIYRHIMASLVRALDNYIVTTCIQTSWIEFENDLKKARTLDDLYECHVGYIKKVLFRCLLNNRSTPVMKLLNDIFTVILKFSRVLKAGEWQFNESTGHFTHTNYAQMEELFHLFEKLAKYLHKVVTRLMECGYQRHLVELLTLVNLNGYYDPDRSKDEQNSSIQYP